MSSVQAAGGEDGSVFGFKKEFRFAENRSELIQPSRLRVKLGEKRPLYPIRITPLKEPQDEYFFATDMGDALYFDFAWAGTHARSPGRASQSRDLLNGALVDVPGARQGYLKAMACAGVARNRTLLPVC